MEEANATVNSFGKWKGKEKKEVNRPVNKSTAAGGEVRNHIHAAKKKVPQTL
jgi:hypothetical protein